MSEPVLRSPLLGSVAHKAAQIAKAALPAAEAAADVVAKRRAICAACPTKATRTIPVMGTTVDVCSACGCPIQRKTARADSQCPQSKW